MDEKNTNSKYDLKQIGLIKILSNLDTQSAVVAAIVISLITVVTSGFLNLCHYIYWSAYFSRFNIPLAYLEEAIIPTSGTKYTLILFIPVIIFVWWILGEIFACTQKAIGKIKTKRSLRHDKKTAFAPSKLNIVIQRILCFFAVMISFLFFLAVWSFLVDAKGLNGIWSGINVIYLEIAFYFLMKISRACFGQMFSFSKKSYIVIRVIGVILVLYIILAEIYVAGNFDNYSNGDQSVKIINDQTVDFHNLKNDTEYEVNIVLFETADYYYITDAKMKITDNKRYFTVLDDDSYKFIDKKENPIKTVYGNLFTIGHRGNNTLDPNMDGYFFGILGLIFVYVCLLGIPMKTENYDKSKISEDT